MSEDLDLIRGTLDLFVLKTLTWGPMHGLAILRWIEQVTERRLQIEEGALYPALHRMEQKGWLDGEWGVTDANRRAKYYKLTARGRKHFEARLTLWERYTQAAAMVLSSMVAALANGIVPGRKFATVSPRPPSTNVRRETLNLVMTSSR